MRVPITSFCLVGRHDFIDGLDAAPDCDGHGTIVSRCRLGIRLLLRITVDRFICHKITPEMLTASLTLRWCAASPLAGTLASPRRRPSWRCGCWTARALEVSPTSWQVLQLKRDGQQDVCCVH